MYSYSLSHASRMIPSLSARNLISSRARHLFCPAGRTLHGTAWRCRCLLLVAPDPGPWTELYAEPGDDGPRGEAGRPQGWRPWRADGYSEDVVNSSGSKILTLLDNARV